MKSNEPFHHCYATANDMWNYCWDFENLTRIKKNADKNFITHLYIAISLVRKKNIFDLIFINCIKIYFIKTRNVKLCSITFKSNKGRDFSSYYIMSNEVLNKAKYNDYVFFQNRSGFGPFGKKWSANFIDQFNKFENIAICGSTINFMDHPRRSNRDDLAHVQTYAFLTKVNILDKIFENFPAINETNRLDIIYNGEIEFSQFFLKKGYGINCVEWPNTQILKTTKAIVREDVRGIVKKNHQFYHISFFKLKKTNRQVKLIQYIKNVLRTLF